MLLTRWHLVLVFVLVFCCCSCSGFLLFLFLFLWDMRTSICQKRRYVTFSSLSQKKTKKKKKKKKKKKRRKRGTERRRGRRGGGRRSHRVNNVNITWLHWRCVLAIYSSGFTSVDDWRCSVSWQNSGLERYLVDGLWKTAMDKKRLDSNVERNRQTHPVSAFIILIYQQVR